MEVESPTAGHPDLRNAPLNQSLLRAAVAVIVAQFVIFKCIYPYAGFIDGDSYVYLQSAFFNLDINTYPVGYSKFLRIFSTFTRSDTALVAFQYLAIQVAGLWLLFTLAGTFMPRKVASILIMAAVVCNPVLLYVSNYVSSDALFLALSLAWFTMLLKMLKSPTIKNSTLQAALLLAAFMVRYNALYYPLIATIAIVMARQRIRRKLLGVTITILPVLIFITYDSSRYYVETGVREFTPFSGWQLANNALYAYRYVNSDNLKTPPPALQPLDRLVRHYFDTTRDPRLHPEEMIVASTVYMWDPRSPLNKFMDQVSKMDSASGYLKRWARMAPLYTQYGAWLIRQYPQTYLKYFLLPNAAKYYAPPGEFLDNYNMGRDTVAAIAQHWFEYPSSKVRPAAKDSKIKIMEAMPIDVAMTNITFILSWIGLILLTGFNRRSLEHKILLLALTLWIANFCFSVLASPVTLRYQLFGLVTFSSFAILLLDRILERSFARPSQ